MPALPRVTLPSLLDILPTALAFTLLGGIESLLSAKVADGMTARVHRPNMELVAEGWPTSPQPCSAASGLSFVICPSVWPFDHGSVIAARTAASS